jgi:very-short-patch-repair endonuclease
MDRRAGTALAERVEAQHGVVTRLQLVAFGVSTSAIDSRLRRGALRPLHVGVYAVGHTALRPEGRWLAAVLACGDGAVLSHLSAARLWDMSSVPADRVVHVTVPGGDHARPGVATHRAPSTGADVTRHRGVPTTTPARTLVDLADLVSYATLRRIADHGVRLDATAVRRAQVRAPNRRGRGKVARLLGDDGTMLRTRSGLERHMRRLAREAGLEAPLVNHRILGHERDFAWPRHRLVVEVDGGPYHAARGAREVDHERDAGLVLAGWRVLRFTDAQLDHDAAAVTGRLARAAAAP